MTLHVSGVRPAVLAPETERVLQEFLRFRHAVRNLYGFELEWARMKPLIRGLAGAFDLVRADLDRFLDYLADVADE